MPMSFPDLLRVAHVVAAAVLGVFVYSPLADDSSAIWITRFAVYPVLLVTGAVLWIRRVRAIGRARAERATGG